MEWFGRLRLSSALAHDENRYHSRRKISAVASELVSLSLVFPTFCGIAQDIRPFSSSPRNRQGPQFILRSSSTCHGNGSPACDFPEIIQIRIGRFCSRSTWEISDGEVRRHRLPVPSAVLLFFYFRYLYPTFKAPALFLILYHSVSQASCSRLPRKILLITGILCFSRRMFGRFH